MRLNRIIPTRSIPSTVIEFRLPAAGIVSLKVYNILGQVVTTLAEGMQPAGNYSVRFEGQGLSYRCLFLPPADRVVRPGPQDDVAEVAVSLVPRAVARGTAFVSTAGNRKILVVPEFIHTPFSSFSSVPH